MSRHQNTNAAVRKAVRMGRRVKATAGVRNHPKRPGLGLFAASGQLVLDELGPDFVGLPDGVEVALGFGGRNAFEEHTVKEHKCGDAHVGGAVNEDGAVIECLNDSIESAKVLRCWRLEIHGNVNVRHAETGNEAAFVRECVIRGWEGEIDDGFEARFPNLAKLFFCRLAGSGEFVSQRPEVVDVGEGCGIHVGRRLPPQRKSRQRPMSQNGAVGTPRPTFRNSISPHGGEALETAHEGSRKGGLSSGVLGTSGGQIEAKFDGRFEFFWMKRQSKHAIRARVHQGKFSFGSDRDGNNRHFEGAPDLPDLSDGMNDSLRGSRQTRRREEAIRSNDHEIEFLTAGMVS